MPIQSDFFLLPPLVPGGNCGWSAYLDIAATNISLDFAGSDASLPPGPSTITIDFNGNLIAQSNQNAPYRIRDITVVCDSSEVTFPDSPALTGFTASQFRNIPQAITVQPAAPALAVPRGGGALMEIVVNGQGGLRQTANLSVSNLPANTAAGFSPFPGLTMNEHRSLTVSATLSATLGSYPIQVNATGDILSASAPSNNPNRPRL